MAYSSATWNQLKELTLEELAKALNGWTVRMSLKVNTESAEVERGFHRR